MTPIPTLSIAARMLLSDQSSAWMRAADAARAAGRLDESDALYEVSEAVDELLDNLADAPAMEAIEAQQRAEDERCPLLHGPEDMRRAILPKGFMSTQRAFPEGE